MTTSTGRRTLAEQLAENVVPIDWADFWSTDVPAIEWLVEPLVPAGRQVAIYSPAKSGKSLVALDVAAALATGRSLLGGLRGDPRPVMYLDLEMTENDVRERLVDLGYGPDDDLSLLAYYQLPTLPALDTDRGGQVLEALLDRHSPVLVIVDTMARVTEGDENDAGTYANFYAATGIRLKRRGISLVRLDHAGKDLTRGQRGSSGKADDVDVVFRLGVVDDKVVLTRTHSRIPWVPAEVALRRETEPVLRHVLVDGGWPSGTKECADLLDELEVPIDATSRTAADAIKRHTGKGRRTQIVTAALRFRKVRSESGNTPGNTLADSQRETSGTVPSEHESSQVEAIAMFPGNNGKRPRSEPGNMCPPLGGHVPDTGPELSDEDLEAMFAEESE